MEQLGVDELYRRFGALLRGARKAAGVSQDALASKIGMTRTSISNLEAGRQRPPLHVVYDLARVLRLSPRELLPDPAKEQDDREGLLQEVDELQREWVRRVITKLDSEKGN